MSAVIEHSRVGSSDPPPNILVMEDEVSVAKGLEMTLEEEGYLVDLALNGKSAIDTFQKKDFDLLVADLRLPDINGMDVIRNVKETHPDTVVVVITGYASVDSVVESMRLGAYDYLSKPFTEDQIKTTVDKALKQKQLKQPPVSVPKPESAEDKLIQKREVNRVLNRTAEDAEFWKELMQNGSAALQEYRLSDEAKAAVASGDLKWLNEQVGELTQKQLLFIYKRLEREAW
jgi:DNA-binding NtrC family response regulator